MHYTAGPMDRRILARIVHELACALACLLILQEHFLQSAVITDAPLVQKIPFKNNIRRDHHMNYQISGLEIRVYNAKKPALGGAGIM
jgi:hypothetical protein